jgi:hypothetical protein
MARRKLDPESLSSLHTQEPRNRYRREHDRDNRKELTWLLAILGIFFVVRGPLRVLVLMVFGY